MSSTNGTLVSKKDTSILLRATFEGGMLLQHEDLEQLNIYTRDLSRLLFRSFFGCGVVCGLVVTTGEDKCGRPSITVGSGLALDCGGAPIYVPKDQILLIDEQCDPAAIPGTLWIVLCGFSKPSKPCGRCTSMCGPDDEYQKPICSRERDWFEIRIVKDDPQCVCRCPESQPGGDQGMRQGWSEYSPPAEQLIHAAQKSRSTTDCWCVDPNDPCYADHYAGKCGCKCDSDCGCCDCVLLAKLTNDGKGNWNPDHSVRRFIRPVLMRDPRAHAESIKTSDKATEFLNADAERKIVERKLEEAAGKEKMLQQQLGKLSEQNKELIAVLERIKKRELEEHEKAEDEKKQRQATKAAKKKDTP
jgi:hypothetical protein